MSHLYCWNFMLSSPFFFFTCFPSQFGIQCHTQVFGFVFIRRYRSIYDQRWKIIHLLLVKLMCADLASLSLIFHFLVHSYMVLLAFCNNWVEITSSCPVSPTCGCINHTSWEYYRYGGIHSILFVNCRV